MARRTTLSDALGNRGRKRLKPPAPMPTHNADNDVGLKPPPPTQRTQGRPAKQQPLAKQRLYANPNRPNPRAVLDSGHNTTHPGRQVESQRKVPTPPASANAQSRNNNVGNRTYSPIPARTNENKGDREGMKFRTFTKPGSFGTVYHEYEIDGKKHVFGIKSKKGKGPQATVGG